MPSPLLSRLEALTGPLPAVEDDGGLTSFAQLIERAGIAARALVGAAGRTGHLDGARVALLAEPGSAWLAAFFGVLRAGGIAVPLSPLYPPHELGWFFADADVELLVVSPDLHGRATAALGHSSAKPHVVELDGLLGGAAASAFEDAPLDPSSVALLLYTSGTTGKPKGAMLTHDNLTTQARLLHDAWGWSRSDRLVHALPLHHLHGLGISLLTSILAGGSVRMLPRFDAHRVWDELDRPECTTFMAVPTMYQKLFEAFDAADAATQARWAAGARSLRLATSGSAALPVTLAERWQALTGAIPLERFGMTEIGVGMSNPLDASKRRAGSVGPLLPTVELRLVDDKDTAATATVGEAWFRGPSIFAGYWRRDDATAAAFAEGGPGDGWFKSGDLVELAPDGYVRVLGRTSVDILKSGGYKLSALEIEEALRDNDAIAEVAVVGVPDEVWGERVVAVVVPALGRGPDCASEVLRAWAKERLAPYKVPREFVVRSALPRNAVGKVVKPELVKSLRA